MLVRLLLPVRRPTRTRKLTDSCSKRGKAGQTGVGGMRRARRGTPAQPGSALLSPSFWDQLSPQLGAPGLILPPYRQSRRESLSCLWLLQRELDWALGALCLTLWKWALELTGVDSVSPDLAWSACLCVHVLLLSWTSRWVGGWLTGELVGWGKRMWGRQFPRGTRVLWPDWGIPARQGRGSSPLAVFLFLTHLPRQSQSSRTIQVLRMGFTDAFHILWAFKIFSNYFAANSHYLCNIRFCFVF